MNLHSLFFFYIFAILKNEFMKRLILFFFSALISFSFAIAQNGISSVGSGMFQKHTGLPSNANEIAGCQDTLACNYNVEATVNDGSCLENDSDAPTVDVVETGVGAGTIVDNDSDNDGICDANEIVGCQDNTACNYNVSATDSASCIYSINLIYSSCVTLGDTIVLTPDNGFSAFWEITDPSGSVITPGFPVNYSASYALAVTQTGVYTVEVDQSNATQCLETFTITVYSSPFSISPLSIPNACQGQTVNLIDYISVSNASVLPLSYDFSINGNLITNPSNYVLPSGNLNIDVLFTDVSSCYDTTLFNLFVDSNLITFPGISIQDVDSNQNIIKPCGSTDITFSVLNPDSSFSYSWFVQGNSYQGITVTESIDAPSANPGYIPVVLSVFDSISGCTVDFTDTITSVGLGSGIGGGLQTDIVPLCAGIPNLLWVENGSSPVLNMGPGDTIAWEMKCSAAVLDTSTWIYTDITSYLTPHPFIANTVVAAYVANFPHSSCGCTDTESSDQFRIKAVLHSVCLTTPITFITYKTVNDPMQADFSSADVCFGTISDFTNISVSGCDGNSFDTSEDTLRYSWDFGDCSPIQETFSIANTGNEFPNISHLYASPGVFTVTLIAESYCGTDTISHTVTVRPDPLLDIQGEDVCFNDTTKFYATVAPANDTSIIYNCQNSNITIQIIGGDSLFTFNWSMIDTVDGTYVNNTSSSSKNPEFIFNSCGIKSVTLSVNDLTDCDIIDSLDVTVFDLPTAILSSPLQNEYFCSGDALLITDSSHSNSACPTNPLDLWNITITENFGSSNSNPTTYNSSPSILDYALSPTCNTTDPNYPNYNYTINLTVTINNSTTGTSSETACDSYDWNGTIYNTSGSYDQAFTNVAGCDSVHTLVLTINNSTTGTSSETACDSYDWNGTIYNTSGSYDQAFTNVAGCDSTVTNTVTINPSFTSVSVIESCDSIIYGTVIC